MPEGELDDREPDPDPLGARRQRGGEHDRIAVDALAGEVVLGEPDAVEAERDGADGLLELLIDAPGVRLRRGGVRQRQSRIA